MLAQPEMGGDVQPSSGHQVDVSNDMSSSLSGSGEGGKKNIKVGFAWDPRVFTE